MADHAQRQRHVPARSQMISPAMMLTAISKFSVTTRRARRATTVTVEMAVGSSHITDTNLLAQMYCRRAVVTGEENRSGSGQGVESPHGRDGLGTNLVMQSEDADRCPVEEDDHRDTTA